MSRKDPQILLRLPADLKDFLQEEARRHKRSLNSEILGRLEITTDLSRQALKAIDGTAQDTAEQTLLASAKAARELADTLEAGLELMRDKLGDAEKDSATD